MITPLLRNDNSFLDPAQSRSSKLPPVAVKADVTPVSPAANHRPFDEQLYERWRALLQTQDRKLQPATGLSPEFAHILPDTLARVTGRPGVSARRLQQFYARPRDNRPTLQELA